MSDSE